MSGPLDSPRRFVQGVIMHLTDAIFAVVFIVPNHLLGAMEPYAKAECVPRAVCLTWETNKWGMVQIAVDRAWTSKATRDTHAGQTRVLPRYPMVMKEAVQHVPGASNGAN